VFYGRDAMDEREQRSELWSFREGTFSPKDSIKNFRVEASDGHAGKVSWSEFSKQYRAELFLGGAIESRNASIKNHGQKFTLRLIKELARAGDVTLLCHCAEAEKHCHRHLLQALILSSRV